MPRLAHLGCMRFVYFFGFVVFFGSQPCQAADFCYFDNRVKYCDYGCCSEKCCGLSTMAIVGIVIGAVIALAAVVGCVICLACMCKQSANRQSNMVQPYQNTNSVYVHNSAHPPPRHPPPSYGQYSSYPGSTDTGYGINDPAYPPSHPPPPAYTYSNPDSGKY